MASKAHTDPFWGTGGARLAIDNESRKCPRGEDSRRDARHFNEPLHLPFTALV
jgi:hypothetical protein